jgi:hemerythrin-like domain-containing protein
MFLAQMRLAEYSHKGGGMPNALEMLRQDHEKVKGLFEEFENAEGQAKEEIVANTVRELEVHAALEEEIFYPAAEEQVDEKESIDEAREEHHVVKLLIGELKKMSAEDERYDAKYTVLAESVKHHIEEEESELFPKLEGKIDAEELGAKMETRKQELQRQPEKRSGARGVKSKRRTRGRKARQTGAKKTRRKASGGRR